MVFSSIPFLYVFLPLVLILYVLAEIFCKKARNLLLLIFSVVFYAYGEPGYVVLMLLTILYIYIIGRLLTGCREKKAGKWLVAAGCAVPFGFLFYFKYADFVLDTANQSGLFSIPLLRLTLPVGISFYTFQAISYLIDLYRNDVKEERSFINLAAYVTLFPQLIAGPIVRFQNVAEELKERSITLPDFSYGIRRFTIGLGKKILLANQLALICTACREEGTLSVLALWVYAAAFSLQVYFDFSGYSDMAIGMGKMLGFHFPENFNYPYISRSITEFWRRWHMTLGQWFRDYVYIPLGGNRVPRMRWLGNLLLVWSLTGLWHGAGWNFLLWGLWYGIWLIVEKLYLGKILDKMPLIVRHLYVLLMVLLGFVLFNAESMTQVFSEIGGMFGMSSLTFANEGIFYVLRNNAMLLLISVLGATPLAKNLIHKLEKTVIPGLLEAPVIGMILLLCTAYLVDGSFNPFLYFRF